jgi:hypothetical protein
MIKFALALVLFAFAGLLAGIYGAVHNQISYTVSPEYFTQFKFQQFQIGEDIPDRLGAAIVGWNAAWWMGILIGMVLIPMGLFIRGNAPFFWVMIRVFGIVVLTTLIVGLAALAVAFVVVDAEMVGEIEIYGKKMTDDLAVVRAGTMHNFSYLGGAFGLVLGGLTILRSRRRFGIGHGNATG